MRLLNMKRMKTENNALFIESWSRTLFTEVVQSDTPEKPAKLRRIFRSNCLRQSMHNLIIVAWLFVAKTYVFNLLKVGSSLRN